MHEEPSKKSLDEQVVMAGSVEAERPAEEDVKLPKETMEVKEEGEHVTAKDAQKEEEKIDLEDKPAVEQIPAKDVPSMEEKIEVGDSPAAEQVTAKNIQPVKEKIEVEDEPVVEQEEKATSAVVLEDTPKQDKAEETVAGEAVVADAPEEEAEDSDDHTEKALSDDGSVQRQSLKIDTQQDTTEDGTTTDTSVDDKLVTPIAEHITESPQPQTPTTPDDVRMSNASMTSVSLSETDMSYDHLSAEQVEDFLATPRNNGSRHIRRPSSLEILGNCWEPARESTIFDANKPSAPPTPNLEQEEITDGGLNVDSQKPKSRKSNASSMATTTRGSQSSEDEANEVDWKQLERHEMQEKSDKDLPEGAEDDSTAFLLARLEQENAILTSDPKAATHKPVKRARGKSRPPSMAQLRKLVTQNDTPSIRYSLAPSMEVLEEPPPMTELEFWTALVQDYPSTAARLPTLTTSKIRAGIPPPLRGVVWASMAGARDRSLEDAFDRLLDEKSPYEGIINKDVGRSFPGVDLFRDAGGEGQKMLGRVLKCFSLHDKDIGYCQGLGFLVGPLLMNMGERSTLR